MINIFSIAFAIISIYIMIQTLFESSKFARKCRKFHSDISKAAHDRFGKFDGLGSEPLRIMKDRQLSILIIKKIETITEKKQRHN